MIFVSPQMFILNVILSINNIIKNLILPTFFIFFFAYILFWYLSKNLFLSMIFILITTLFIGYKKFIKKKLKKN